MYVSLFLGHYVIITPLLLRSCLQTLLFSRNKPNFYRPLLQVQHELEALIHQQTMDQQQAEGMVSLCQYAIKKEIQKEKSRFTFKEIFKIATACVKIYAAFYDGKCQFKFPPAFNLLSILRTFVQTS